MKTTALFLAAFLSAAISLNAAPAKSTILSSEMSAADLDFMHSAAEGQLLQTTLGDLAAKQATSKSVQAFAASLRKDNVAQGDELKKLATEMQYSLPTTISVEQATLVKRLARLKGDKFDKALMGSVIQAQQKEITDFQQGARSKDERIKSFAQNSVPPLSEHLLLAKKILGMASAGKLFKARLPAFSQTEEKPETSSAEESPSPLKEGAKDIDGSLDVANGKIIGGWAYDRARPNAPVSVEIYDGTTLLLTVPADKFRGDLPGAKKENGPHCFFLPTPSVMLDGKPHWVPRHGGGHHLRATRFPKVDHLPIVATPA